VSQKHRDLGLPARLNVVTNLTATDRRVVNQVYPRQSFRKHGAQIDWQGTFKCIPSPFTGRIRRWM